MTLKLSPLRSIGVSILAYTILCSTLPAVPSKTVRSNYAIRSCSITSAPNIPPKWEDHNPRLSSTLKEGIPVLPIDFSPRTSYIEQAWIVFHLEVQSLEIDDGSSDTCSALHGLSPLKVVLLPFCRVDFWQNELQVDRSGTLSPGNVSSPEYLFEEYAWCRTGCPGYGFLFHHFELFIILLPSILFLQALCGTKNPRSRDLSFSKSLGPCAWDYYQSQIYEKLCLKLEPHVPAGKTRLRWNCHCGRRLYDDFEELRPGAVAELERSLNKASGHTRQYAGVTITFYDDVYDPSKDAGPLEQQRLSRPIHGHGSGKSLIQAPMDRSFAGGTIQNQATGLGGLSQLDARGPSTGQNPRSTPPHRAQNIAEVASEAPNPPRPDSLFLLLCIPHRQYATKLIHMDVCMLLSDRLFFANLRGHYRSMRGRWVSIFSLRQLRSIRFVKFEMYPSTLVDIRKTNDIPPETHKDEYRYRPVPAEVIPPIGENHLMHLYDHPEDAEDTAICLDKVPKKLREPLLVCPQRGTGLGWGIHFVEGLHWIKLWILGFIGLLAALGPK